jgi:hypothetical protein
MTRLFALGIDVGSTGRRTRPSALGLAALWLAGCVVSHPDYPASWAPREIPSTGCVSIAGKYSNVGDGAHSASYFLFPRDTKLGGANTLAIAEREGTIEITALWGVETVTAQRRLAGDEYQCRDGAIELTMRESVAGGQAAGVETNTVRLMKSTDGALVIKHSSSSVGVCLVVPCGGSVDKWYRFKPADQK